MRDQEILDRAERAADRVVAPEGRFEDLLHRRDRKRRNQRITAGAVGIAVFVAAVWIVTTGGPFDHAADGGQQPATSGATNPGVAPPGTTEPWVAPPVTTAPWVTAPATSEVDFLMDVNTGEVTPLPEAILGARGEGQGAPSGRADGRYAASPDGSTLAFTGVGEVGTPQIFVANIDGTGVRQVTHDPIGAASPDWSPDGTMIAYVGNSRVGYGNLFVLDVATGESTKISGENVGSPSFTPDGSSLLYTSGMQFPLEVRTVPIAGGESRPLFGADVDIVDSGGGSISPDGTLVTFLGSGDPPTDEVGHCGPCRFVADVDGSNRQVINGWMANPAGTWSPDGSRIVAEEIVGELQMEELGRTYTDVILVVDVATEEATVVAYGRTAIWIDDHTVLIEV